SIIASNLVSFAIQLILFCAVYLLLALTNPSAPGKWNAPFEGQIGQEKYTFAFKVEGDKTTVKTKRESPDQKTETEVKGSKIVNDEVSFTEMIRIQDREVPTEYTGKLVGDEL